MRKVDSKVGLAWNLERLYKGKLGVQGTPYMKMIISCMPFSPSPVASKENDMQQQNQKQKQGKRWLARKERESRKISLLPKEKKGKKKELSCTLKALN